MPRRYNAEPDMGALRAIIDCVEDMHSRQTPDEGYHRALEHRQRQVYLRANATIPEGDMQETLKAEQQRRSAEQQQYLQYRDPWQMGDRPHAPWTPPPPIPPLPMGVRDPFDRSPQPRSQQQQRQQRRFASTHPDKEGVEFHPRAASNRYPVVGNWATTSTTTTSSDNRDSASARYSSKAEEETVWDENSFLSKGSALGGVPAREGSLGQHQHSRHRFSSPCLHKNEANVKTPSASKSHRGNHQSCSASGERPLHTFPRNAIPEKLRPSDKRTHSSTVTPWGETDQSAFQTSSAALLGLRPPPSSSASSSFIKERTPAAVASRPAKSTVVVAAAASSSCQPSEPPTTALRSVNGTSGSPNCDYRQGLNVNPRCSNQEKASASRAVGHLRGICKDNLANGVNSTRQTSSIPVVTTINDLSGSSQPFLAALAALQQAAANRNPNAALTPHFSQPLRESSSTALPATEGTRLAYSATALTSNLAGPFCPMDDRTILESAQLLSSAILSLATAGDGGAALPTVTSSASMPLSRQPNHSSQARPPTQRDVISVRSNGNSQSLSRVSPSPIPITAQSRSGGGHHPALRSEASVNSLSILSPVRASQQWQRNPTLSTGGSDRGSEPRLQDYREAALSDLANRVVSLSRPRGDTAEREEHEALRLEEGASRPLREVGGPDNEPVFLIDDARRSRSGATSSTGATTSRSRTQDDEDGASEERDSDRPGGNGGRNLSPLQQQQQQQRRASRQDSAPSDWAVTSRRSGHSLDHFTSATDDGARGDTERQEESSLYHQNSENASATSEPHQRRMGAAGNRCPLAPTISAAAAVGDSPPAQDGDVVSPRYLAQMQAVDVSLSPPTPWDRHGRQTGDHSDDENAADRCDPSHVCGIGELSGGEGKVWSEERTTFMSAEDDERCSPSDEDPSPELDTDTPRRRRAFQVRLADEERDCGDVVSDADTNESRRDREESGDPYDVTPSTPPECEDDTYQIEDDTEEGEDEKGPQRDAGWQTASASQASSPPRESRSSGECRSSHGDERAIQHPAATPMSDFRPACGGSRSDHAGGEEPLNGEVNVQNNGVDSSSDAEVWIDERGVVHKVLTPLRRQTSDKDLESSQRNGSERGGAFLSSPLTGGVNPSNMSNTPRRPHPCSLPPPVTTASEWAEGRNVSNPENLAGNACRLRKDAPPPQQSLHSNAPLLSSCAKRDAADKSLLFSAVSAPPAVPTLHQVSSADTSTPTAATADGSDNDEDSDEGANDVTAATDDVSLTEARLLRARPRSSQPPPVISAPATTTTTASPNASAYDSGDDVEGRASVVHHRHRCTSSFSSPTVGNEAAREEGVDERDAAASSTGAKPHSCCHLHAEKGAMGEDGDEDGGARRDNDDACELSNMQRLHRRDQQDPFGDETVEEAVNGKSLAGEREKGWEQQKISEASGRDCPLLVSSTGQIPNLDWRDPAVGEEGDAGRCDALTCGATHAVHRQWQDRRQTPSPAAEDEHRSASNCSENAQDDGEEKGNPNDDELSCFLYAQPQGPLVDGNDEMLNSEGTLKEGREPLPHPVYCICGHRLDGWGRCFFCRSDTQFYGDVPEEYNYFATHEKSDAARDDRCFLDDDEASSFSVASSLPTPAQLRASRPRIQTLLPQQQQGRRRSDCPNTVTVGSPERKGSRSRHLAYLAQPTEEAYHDDSTLFGEEEEDDNGYCSGNFLEDEMY